MSLNTINTQLLKKLAQLNFSYCSQPFLIIGLSCHIISALTVRPGATGLLIGVEYSGARDNTWNTPYYLVSTRAAVGLVDVQGNYSTSLE